MAVLRFSLSCTYIFLSSVIKLNSKGQPIRLLKPLKHSFFKVWFMHLLVLSVQQQTHMVSTGLSVHKGCVPYILQDSW